MGTNLGIFIGGVIPPAPRPKTPVPAAATDFPPPPDAAPDCKRA